MDTQQDHICTSAYVISGGIQHGLIKCCTGDFYLKWWNEINFVPYRFSKIIPILRKPKSEFIFFWKMADYTKFGGSR
jgi:hypothetical protein